MQEVSSSLQLPIKTLLHYKYYNMVQIENKVCLAFSSNQRVTNRMSTLSEQNCSQHFDSSRMNQAQNEHRQLEITEWLRVPSYAVEKLYNSGSFFHHQFLYQSNASSTNGYVVKILTEPSCLTSYSVRVLDPYMQHDVGDTITVVVRATVV